MAQRRLLLLITDLQRGGTPTVVRELAIRLRQASSDTHVEVACLAPWGPVADDLIRAAVPVTALGARRATDVRAFTRLLKLLRDQQFDTVFSFLLHANALAAASLPWAPPARWIQSIQTTQPWPAWHWHLQRLVHRAADTVVVPSTAVADAAASWAAIPAEKIAVIPNAIDLADFAGMATAEPVVGQPYPITFLGRLDPVKDVPTLIDAVALLNGRVQLTIAGQGSDQTRIEQRIAGRNIPHLVKFVGPVDRPQDAIAASGLLMLPSLAEGFGLVLIEAMAAGIPVVATDIPAVRDVIRNGQTGLLVPPANPVALAAAIQQIVDDSSLRTGLTAAALDDVRQRFTWDVVLPQYLRLLDLA